MSILSPDNSFDTAWTREPRIPTHAPIASSFGSFDLTETLALNPGSLAAPSISIKPNDPKLIEYKVNNIIS